MSSPFIVPLATPYTDDTTSLSEIRLMKLMRWHRERGAGGWLVGAESGEYQSLSLGERKQLSEWVMRESMGDPVIVHVTCNTTAATVDLAQHASRHGAKSAVASLPPMPLMEREVQGYLAALRRHSNLNVTFIDPTEQWSHLATESVSVATLLLHELEPDEPSLGKLKGISEFRTQEMVCSPLNILGGKTAQKVRARWDVLGPIVQGLFRLGGHARVAKAVLEISGLDIGPPRPPQQTADENVRTILNNLLASVERG